MTSSLHAGQRQAQREIIEKNSNNDDDSSYFRSQCKQSIKLWRSHYFGIILLFFNELIIYQNNSIGISIVAQRSF